MCSCLVTVHDDGEYYYRGDFVVPPSMSEYDFDFDVLDHNDDDDDDDDYDDDYDAS